MASTRSQSRFYYDETSAIWQVNRERILLLAGAKVLLMQIAHPMVAESVYHHSYVFKKPVRRLLRTLKLTFAMVFGTREDVHSAIAEIERVHRPATGRLEQGIGRYDSGASYNPRNPRQALWVLATLIEGAISAYETFVAPLSDGQKDKFMEDSIGFATRMGIPSSYVPSSYPALLAYMSEAIATEEVIVSDNARKIAPFITGQSIPGVNVLAYPLYRMNVVMLPESIREQYGYEVGKGEESLVRGVFSTSRQLIPVLPSLIRYIPEYHRAIRMK